MEFVLTESCMGGAKRCKKVTNEWIAVGVIRSIVNAKSLQFECGKALYMGLLVHNTMLGAETLVRRN